MILRLIVLPVDSLVFILMTYFAKLQNIPSSLPVNILNQHNLFFILALIIFPLISYLSYFLLDKFIKNEGMSKEIIKIAGLANGQLLMFLFSFLFTFHIEHILVFAIIAAMRWILRPSMLK